jgi:hypothetical protein
MVDPFPYTITAMSLTGPSFIAFRLCGTLESK